MAQQSAQDGSLAMNVRESIPDKVIMYACVFQYEKPKYRNQILNYQVNYSTIDQYETSGQLQPGSKDCIMEFERLGNDQQRTFLDSRENSESVDRLFRTLFRIVSLVSSDSELVFWALSMINGIIEDSRSRVRLLSNMQKSYNPQKKVDCIRILYSFLSQRMDDQSRPDRDLAAHTLAQIISHIGIEKNQEDADAFMNYLLQAKDQPTLLSRQAYTHSLMYLLKINKLAESFINFRGFHILHKLLISDCQQDAQIAYNVICCLWILSYHDFAMPFFQDFKLMTVEHIAKILDFSNKEKIVRMICHIFNNLKNDDVCLEHLSMINALNLVIKLRNRPWVDEDIKRILELLFEYFDQNYQEFSSFDKWKAQVSRRAFTWSPVHTEKFWQTSFIYFNDPENLECINILIDFLRQDESPQIDKASLDQMKAVACFDLGEFARFFPQGKDFLEERNTKTYLADLMGSPTSSAELKKEAITAYQKMLMHSWGQNLN